LEVLAGQEGFEPTTYGFGIRRSTVRATALCKKLFAFAMNGMLAAELAELLELELIGGFLLVLGGRVILPFAIRAIQTDDHAHKSVPSYGTKPLHVGFPMGAWFRLKPGPLHGNLSTVRQQLTLRAGPLTAR
jgi:hypothetical protein